MEHWAKMGENFTELVVDFLIQNITNRYQNVNFSTIVDPLITDVKAFIPHCTN